MLKKLLGSSIVKKIGGFSFGIFLNQSVNLIMIPILWRHMTPTDYGVLAISQIVTVFLAPIYMYGMSDTIQYYYYKWTDQNRKSHLGWFFWFIFLFTFLLSCFLDFIGQNFSKYLITQVEFSPLIRLTIWTTFFANFVNFPNTLARINQNILRFNLLSNGSFITQITLISWNVIVLQQGASGYINALFTSSVIWALPTLYIIFKDCSLVPNKNQFFIPLRYSTPLCFTGIIEGISNTLDRFFLEKYIPLSTLGFYNLARQLSSPINIINTIAKLILFPTFHKHYSKNKNTSELLERYGFLYSALFLIPTLSLVLLSAEIVEILDTTNNYKNVAEYIPYFCLGFYVTSLATIHGRGMDLVGKSKYTFLMPLLSTLVSVFIYYKTLPILGVYGAIFGLLCNSAIRTFINVGLSYYYLPRNLNIKKTVFTWLLAIAGFIFSVFLNVSVNIFYSSLIDLLIIFVFIIILYQFFIKNDLKTLLQVITED